VKFLPIFLIGILITGLVGLSSFDYVYAEKTHYKIYHEPWPNYAIDYNPIQGAIQFWEKERPDLSFSIVSEQYNADMRIQWVKEKGEHWVGYAYSSLLLVGLGDSYCGEQWNQFHPSYIQNIIAHEMGHRLGYGHETQSDSIMNSGGRGDKHYSKITYEQFLDSSKIPSAWYPTCVTGNGSTLSYSINSLLGKVHSFDLYIVPTYSDVINSNHDKPFSHYVKGTCVSKGTLATHNAKCEVGPGSYLVIKPKEGDAILKITMSEKNFPIKQYKVYKQYNSYKQSDAPVSIVFSINKGTFQAGDPIEIKGKVWFNKIGQETILGIRDSSNNFLTGNEIQLNDKGEFSISDNLPKTLDPGRYSISVEHAGEMRKSFFTITIPQDLGKLEFSNLQILDSLNNSITNIAVGEKVKVSALIGNSQNKEQSFAYLVQIQDARGNTKSLETISGSLQPRQSHIPGWEWTPKAAGTYTVTVFLWKGVDDPTFLAQSIEKRIYVQNNEPEPAPTPPPTQNDDLSEIIEENRKLREELERQGEQIDELNQEVDWLKQIIQNIQGFFSSIFG